MSSLLGQMMVLASFLLVSCERVDQAEEPEYVDVINLQKVEEEKNN